ncbi:MAG: hypothetical protein HZA31_03200 [Opitutae bacterium]|nr:hypothetical protein [Opitutae bacterium]
MGFHFPLFIRLLATLLLGALVGRGAMSEWPNPDGKKFKGEPADVLGPFALFRTGGTSGRMLPLQALAPAECVRFHDELKAQAPASADGTTPRGMLFRELEGHVLQMQQGRLTSVDLQTRPEPEIIVLLSLSHRDGGSLSRVVNALFLQYQRIQKVYPGQLEAVFYNRHQSEEQLQQLARSRRMPWLVAIPGGKEQMKTFARFTPTEGNYVIALSRNGAPLLSAGGHDEAALTQFIDRLANLLSLVQTDNPRNWKDRLHYQRSIRPRVFAEKETGPLLLGQPIRPEGLRKAGIAEVRARLSVTAEGKVDEVRLQRSAGMDEKLGRSLAEVLRLSATFAPAIAHGQPVAGVYDYNFTVPPRDEEIEALAAWLNLDPAREHPIKEWLVLKTFKVEQEDFLEVSHTTDDGVTVFKPVKALQGRAPGETDLKSQKSAFAYDWFSPEECAALHPTIGLKQKIDGATYVWQRFKPDGRFVELNTGLDKEQYCYCYAWTEIEVDQAQPALLGLGSDDGVKVWLNGEVLVEKWVQRPLKIDEDVLPLRLKQGKNQLLLKVQNIRGEWRYSCRLILQGRLPPPAAKPTAAP